MTAKVDRACWDGPSVGHISLVKDWNTPALPPIKLPAGVKGKLTLTRGSSFDYAKESGYAINGEWMSFVAKPEGAEEKLYVAGDFNGWGAAVGQKCWELAPQEIEGETWATLTVKKSSVGEHRLFKFVDEKNSWREPSYSAFNIGYKDGARNLCIEPARTGAHVLRFEVEGGLSWKNLNELVWQEVDHEEKITLWPRGNFYALAPKDAQGAIIEGGKTRFRIFAPRATKVEVNYFFDGEEEKKLRLSEEKDGGWTALVAQNLEGALYYYTIEGPNWPHTHFEPKRKVLDPWALCVRNGLGVIVDKKKILNKAPTPFNPPLCENLIIGEAHVRDLLAHAPLSLTKEERMGFSGIKKLLDWPENPFAIMGLNAVELQPLMAYDSDNREVYQWGYMPINYFAPAADYGSDPAQLKQLEEMAQMVEAFHKKGITVILDVVFNHVGVGAGLSAIDKAYYFKLNADGGMTNWSGCGNDLRIESAMAERMALEALEHWVQCFGIDGFRFDLAELLGVDFLKKVQKRLREIKPGIILIAEPWSFRAHIGGALKETDFINWNDGFREFVPQYLNGNATAEGLKYFIRGSVGGVTKRPVQSLNYVESHDDFTWIDRITQNPAKNGHTPTAQDVRLTHLMAGLMTMSLGVPMWVCGMEAMRSKYGVGNTYLRGDLNAIDYGRMREYPNTVEYFRGLNNFRKSKNGQALRVRELTPEYLKFYPVPHCPALGVLYNAGRETAAKRILYVVNPIPNPIKLELHDLDAGRWLQVADHERVNEAGLPFGRWAWNNGVLEVPGMSAGVWVEQN